MGEWLAERSPFMFFRDLCRKQSFSAKSMAFFLSLSLLSLFFWTWLTKFGKLRERKSRQKYFSGIFKVSILWIKLSVIPAVLAIPPCRKRASRAAFKIVSFLPSSSFFWALGYSFQFLLFKILISENLKFWLELKKIFFCHFTGWFMAVHVENYFIVLRIL